MMKLNELKLDDDKKQLRLNVDEAENQLMKAELLRQSLEGDIQRLKLALNDRETENQVISNRAENLTRQVQDLENKASCLSATADRLRLTLARTEQQESDYKHQVLIIIIIIVIIIMIFAVDFKLLVLITRTRYSLQNCSDYI